MTSKQVANRIFRQRQVSAAARKLTEAQGVTWTVADLAKELDIAVGTIYHLYESKDEILSQMLFDDLANEVDPFTAVVRYLPPALQITLEDRKWKHPSDTER